MRQSSTWHLKRSWSFLLGFGRLDLPYAFRRRHGVVYDYITTLVSRPITKDFSREFRAFISLALAFHLCRTVLEAGRGQKVGIAVHQWSAEVNQQLGRGPL